MAHTHAITELFTLQFEQLDYSPKQQLQLNPDIDSELMLLLNNYKVVFSVPSGLPPSRSQNHFIPLLQGSEPVKVRPYRYPHSQKQQIEIMVQHMLKEGLIVPSTSPFSSPIILVKKKNGTWHFCTDYRALNAITVKDSFPIPSVDELIDELHGAQFFSKLGLHSSYHKILSLMDDVFQGLLRKFVLSTTLLGLLIYCILKLFCRNYNNINSLPNYLNALLAFNKLGVAMDKSKMQVVMDWPCPNNLKQLRGFVGLIGYYRRFINQYAVSTYTREFYAITEAIGSSIRNPNRSKKLKKAEEVIQTLKQQKWLHKLLGYDFTIEYKPGKDNIVADSLSRSYFMAWEVVSQDPHLKGVLDLCLLNQPSNPHYSVHDNLLFWKGRLVIPQSHALIQHILHEFHSSLMGEHAGFTRSLARIAAQFYWKGVNKDDDIAMDFITGLPSSNDFMVILVVVDRLSKYGHFPPLKADYSNKSVVEIFVKSVVKLHGIPKIIVSDRDKQLFKLSGTSLNMSTAYHPQSDGQSESLNKCLEMYLRCFTYESPKYWAKLLPWAEYRYNTSYHHSCGRTPFTIVYGRDPPALVKYTLNPHNSPSVQEQLLQRDVIISKFKFNLHKAQQYMKKQADKKRKFMELQIGELVLVKLQPYRQHFVAL
ncbi:hypothetical protein V8G54_021443 [Vigna mungo]|uniref:Integrase catalytic domain-containing protein n=1 Tax=Vigna mungo TaxID=3915 RepID=A0AAQ3NED5_VIGMU